MADSVNMRSVSLLIKWIKIDLTDEALHVSLEATLRNYSVQ